MRSNPESLDAHVNVEIVAFAIGYGMFRCPLSAEIVAFAIESGKFRCPREC